MRVASLIPSGTDTVAALGLGHLLVGVSHECDHPVAVGLPVLTRSALPTGDPPPLPPAEIDRRVTASVEAGEPLYHTDRAKLADLAPDVVLSQDVCDVCAVPGAAAAADVPAGAELVMLRATSLAGLEDDVARVGKALDAGDRAERLIASIRSAHVTLATRVVDLPRPRVLALEWGDPPFLGGHWIPELVGVAGGEHVLSAPGDASRRSDWDEIAAADPDVIISMPCGYGIEAAAAEGRTLVQRPEVARLRAVRDGRFWATNATTLFSRCTPAVVTAAPILAAIFHPGRFPAVPPTRAVPVRA